MSEPVDGVQGSRLGAGGVVLGINAAYHQPSACLVRDGVVVAAVEEERFNRIKGGKQAVVDNTLVLPFASIDYVLREGGVQLDDVDLIGTGFSPARRLRGKELWARYAPVLAGEYETPAGDRAFRRLLHQIPEVIAARFDVDRGSVRRRFRWVPHHLSHLASAFYPSPFSEAAGLCIDGIGEFDTTTLADCDERGIRTVEKIDYPHSLGFVWEVVTNFLGFKGDQDECKIMGLAAYGDPAAQRAAFSKIIRPGKDGRFTTLLDPAVIRHDYSTFERLFGVNRRLPYEPLAWQGADRRHADLAAALQEKTNEVFLHLAERVRVRTGRRHLVLAGGVALNCVANGQVAEFSGFDDVYVQAAAGDAGTAIGAALHLACEGTGAPRRQGRAMPTPFLGPAFSDDDIKAALERFRLPNERVADPTETAASLLATGKVVGWFQGRMEFGPRALGNRSLLADPTLPAIRHTLNLQVKHREEFRPLCPTVLAEFAEEWIDASRPLCQASRLMLATYRIRPDRIARIPAVLHQDGSARIQVLHREDNPVFHQLLTAFHAKTGVPMLLNTSFNDREPVVCTPEHACECWLKTRFDAMILGSYLVTGLKPWERRPSATAFEIASRRFDAGPTEVRLSPGRGGR